MSIEIEGIDRLIEHLDDIADMSNMYKAVGKACALVEGAAIEKAPKDTGALRRSIQSKVEERGEAVVGTVFTPLEYAPYVEYGTGLFAEKGGRKTGWAYEDEQTGEVVWTRGQHPQPYLRPALNQNREEIKRILREGMK